jgi:hypothetical protein
MIAIVLGCRVFCEKPSTCPAKCTRSVALASQLPVESNLDTLIP